MKTFKQFLKENEEENNPHLNHFVNFLKDVNRSKNNQELNDTLTTFINHPKTSKAMKHIQQNKEQYQFPEGEHPDNEYGEVFKHPELRKRFTRAFDKLSAKISGEVRRSMLKHEYGGEDSPLHQISNLFYKHGLSTLSY